ncbi:MAG: hypothetical protein M3P18_15945 [Actinomycetota bacterium]|nr:hypothetical protein [Actinomycetota bacterium]
MNRIVRLCTVLLAATLAATGCATHEAKFERDVPPRPVDRVAQERTALRAAAHLIEHFRPEMNALPADALAPLTKSAALLFEVTGAPGMRRATRIFADTLLQTRASVGSGQAFYSSIRPGRPSEEATVDAGDALVDAFIATGNERYRAAVTDATRAVTSRSLGWTKVRNGFAVRVASYGARYYSVSRTAAAAAFLFRAAAIDANPQVRPAAARALRLVSASQAAAGRWYETFGARSPMTLASWARTLLALGSSGRSPLRDIENAGALVLWTAAFRGDGTPLNTPLVDRRGFGLAIALSLLQEAGGTKSYADLAYRYALDHRRDDGTVETAAAGDDVVQAYFTLAFAQRAYRLRTNAH